MRVEQIMSRNVRVRVPTDDLRRAARIMWEKDCGWVPIVEPSGNVAPKVVGVITDRDICMAAYIQGKPIEQIVVASVYPDSMVSACSPQDSLDVALRIMRANQVRRLPVLDDGGQLVGVLSLADVAQEGARRGGEWTGSVSFADIGRAMGSISAPRDVRALAATVAT